MITKSMVAFLFALTMASQVGSAQAFISAKSIGNWFVNAIKNFFLWIWNGIIGAVTWLYNALADWATDLAGDVFHSLSSSTTVFQENANKAITKLLKLDEGRGEIPASMRFMMGIMEAGPLPPEWYFSKANPEAEVNHMRYWISNIKWGLIVYIVIAMMLIICFGIIHIRNRRLENRLKREVKIK